VTCAAHCARISSSTRLRPPASTSIPGTGRTRSAAPDGRHHSADDPELLTWVHVAEVWSVLRAYQRYGTRPLLRAEPAALSALRLDQHSVESSANTVPAIRVLLARRAEPYDAT